MAEKSTTHLSPCGQLARQYDPDRFLAALFAPSEERERLFILLAFNAEIARIEESVREPMMGLIRLQWWREGLEAAVPPPHEVLQAIKAAGIARAPLLALLEAREQDYAEEQPNTLAAVEAYAEATSAPLLEAMGSPNPAVAKGYALVGLVRAGRFPDLREAMINAARHSLEGKVKGQARLWQALAKFYLKKGCTPNPHPLRVWPLLWAFFCK